MKGSPRDWFGQPPGLTILFLTEMWEKFSFFGMRTLLVYYMTKQLLMDQESASLTYGVYAACVYLTPIFGGMAADRWLGRRRSVIAGGSIMALGHFMMTSEALFMPALAVIAIGNGLFLPSLPSQIQALYTPDDPRRRGAYNVYYVGVNLGAFLAPLACGYLGETFGWHWGFGLAGLGMVCGLVIYCAGGRHLPADPIAERAAPPQPAVRSMPRHIGVFVAVMAGVVVFRVAYEQIGNTLALWADASVDRGLGGGWDIPMTWFQALNPLLVFMLTPVLVVLWSRREAATLGEPTAGRMAFGAALVAGAYFLLALVCLGSAASGMPAAWPWLLLFFLVLTAGELHILPTGLGLFGRLAPVGFAATAMAAWFLAGFAGNLLAGVFGTLWSHVSPATFFFAAASIATISALILDRMKGLVARAELAASDGMREQP